jgi:DNA-binding transcriptional LysR family regulator
MTVTFRQLQYIIKIVEAGSITEAARELFVTQPSLSNAVKELEDEIGIVIFYRTSRGISLTADGEEFLSYARQVAEQMELLEQRYHDVRSRRQQCSVSTQHYAFAVNAFVDLVKETVDQEYEFTLRETITHDIIEDVANFRSEVGVLYQNSFNKKVIGNLLKEEHLEFHPLFEAAPHVFISATHPLTRKKTVTLRDLEDYPCLTFEQGRYNSFYFSEEILSTVRHKKSLHVSDRATLFNLLIGLHGYTISSGILSRDLNGDNIAARPLETKEKMLIGWITNSRAVLSRNAEAYIEHLRDIIRGYGFEPLS